MAAVSTAFCTAQEKGKSAGRKPGSNFPTGTSQETTPAWSPLGPHTTPHGCEMAARHLSLSGNPCSCVARARGQMSKRKAQQPAVLGMRKPRAQGSSDPGHSLAGQGVSRLHPGITRLGSLARCPLGAGSTGRGLLTQPLGTRAPTQTLQPLGPGKVFSCPSNTGHITAKPRSLPSASSAAVEGGERRRDGTEGVGVVRVPLLAHEHPSLSGHTFE